MGVVSGILSLPNSWILKLAGVRTIWSDFISTNDEPNLSFDSAYFTIVPDPANSRNVVTGGGSNVLSVVGTSPMIAVTVSMGVATISCNGTPNPTGNTLCQRQADGSVCGAYFTTATSAVATSGAFRLPVGDGVVIAIKGASHTSVPLLSTSNSGATLVLGDGTEIQGVNFQSALLSQIGPATFGLGVTPSFSQGQQSGTGAAAGLTWTWTGQQGQNVASGTNNNGSSFVWNAGAVGTGGSGGSQGSMTWNAGGLTMGLTAAGLSIPGAVFPPQTAPSSPASNANALYSLTGTGHFCFKASSGLIVDLTAIGATYASGVVTTIGVTAPITTTGGTTPTIAISAATSSLPGSMSAADKTKLDGMTAGAAVASVGTTSPLTNSGTSTAPVIAIGSAIPANLGGTGLGGPGSAGNVLTSNGSAWTSAAPAAPTGAAAASLFFALSVTLTGGAKTQASGKTLTNAVIVGVLLGAPSTAVGNVTATISGNNVIVTSYTAGAVQAVTDASTYLVMIVGAV